MDPEDFVSPEVGITAAVVATIASPQIRRVVRRGAVFGVAGVLMAGDALTSFARGFGQGITQSAQRVAQGASSVGSQVAQQMPIAHNGQQAENAHAGDQQEEHHHAEA